MLEPGWRWSQDVKPIAGTDLCEAPHFQYHVAGTIRIQLEDGTEFDAGPGEVTALPAGTTPGSSETRRSWPWTGGAPATMPGADRREGIMITRTS